MPTGQVRNHDMARTCACGGPHLCVVGRDMFQVGQRLAHRLNAHALALGMMLFAALLFVLLHSNCLDICPGACCLPPCPWIAAGSRAFRGINVGIGMYGAVVGASLAYALWVRTTLHCIDYGLHLQYHRPAHRLQQQAQQAHMGANSTPMHKH